MRIEVGQQFKERGARGRIFTVTQAAGGIRGPRLALCSFPSEGKARKNTANGANRVALVFAETLRKRFTAVSP